MRAIANPSVSQNQSDPHWMQHIQKLPVLPQVTLKITDRIQKPSADLIEIAGLIESDPGLSAKVLRLANSSYYSIPGGVTEIKKALQYLGLTTISQIVLTTSVVGTFRALGLSDFPLSEFWKHSFATGLAAELAAREIHDPKLSSKEAFMGGLIHDLGKLVLLEAYPNQLQQIISDAKTHSTSFYETELKLKFFPHTDLGSLLASHWNLPEAIRLGIRHHHDETPSVIAWANAWVQEQKIGFSGNYQESHQQVLEYQTNKLGLNRAQIIRIEERFKIEFEKAGAILNGHS
jgi:HD-like signal output (HDOD) protein